MKKVTIVSMAMAASFMLGACNNGGKGSVDNADSANAAKMDSGTVSMNKDEAEFMVQAANGGMTEVKAGQLAADKAQNQRVKDFAAMMVRDHTKANDQLKVLAHGKNITLPDSLSEKSKDDLQKLDKKQGRDFDKAFMKMMLDDHQKTVNDFQKELNDAQSADLKQWISGVLPTLEMHLDSARSINRIYGYTGNTGNMPGTTVPQ